MDQLEILSRLEKLLVEWEKQVSQHYTRLEQQLANVLREAYAKGETLEEQQRYNRLESLKKRIDRKATETYAQAIKDAAAMQESAFNEAYLLYAYLLYLYFAQGQGGPIAITSAAAAVSVPAVIILALLKSVKLDWLAFQKNDDSFDVFSKQKNDAVYSLFMDTRDNLRTAAGLNDALKRLKQRVEKARNRSLLTLRYYFNRAYNSAQGAIYEVLKVATRNTSDEVDKMWVSMKDHRVRYPHQVLDGTLAVNGWFYYGADRARRPHGFKDMSLNYNCRCKIFISFNGRLPRVSRVYDYRDSAFLLKLDERIEELQKSGKTYIQALQQAHKEIKPPRKKMNYFITYEEWLEEFGNQELSGKRKMRDDSNTNGRRVYPVKQSNVNWSDYVNVDEAGSELLNKIHTQLNEFMNKQRLEKLFLVDNRENSIVYELTGESIDKIDVKKDMAQILKKAEPNSLILTHVHPSPTPFSRADIQNMMDFKSIAEFTLECADGSKYVLSRGTLKSGMMHFFTYDRKYEKIYWQVAKNYPDLDDEVKRAAIWDEFIFDVNIEIARAYGMIFKKVE